MNLLHQFERLQPYLQGNPNSLRVTLVRGFSGTFGLYVFSVGIGFVIRLLMARILGAYQLGVYQYTFAWVDIFTVIATFGMTTLLMREVAVCQEKQQWGLLKGVLSFANRTGLALALLLGAIGAAIVWYSFQTWGKARFGLSILSSLSTGGFLSDPTILYAAWLAFLILPLQVLIRLRQAAMRGLNYVVSSQLPEYVVRPLLFIVLFISAYAILGNGLDAAWAMGIQVVAMAVAFAYGAWLLLRVIPTAARSAAAHYQTRIWMVSAIPIFFTSFMNVILARADVILLGLLAGPKEVGVYSSVLQLTQFVNFALVAVSMTTSPMLAQLHEVGEMKRLHKLMVSSARGALLVAGSISALLVLVAPIILNLFGEEFRVGYIPMLIILMGYLFNVASGSVGRLLTMTYHEWNTSLGIAIGAVSNILLNILLIPPYGMIGAAVALTVSTVIWNLVLVGFVWHHFRLNTTVLGSPK